MLKLRTKKLKSIPKDARKSLEVLDKVLKKYDETESKSDNSRRGFMRLFRPKSLEVISTRISRNRQEDIRKSLDILDSVLAEYDDDQEGDSWRHSMPPGDGWRGDNDYVNGCATRRTDLEFSRRRYDASSSASDGICFPRSSSTNSFQYFSIDGGTSQSMPATFDQFRKFSPPPVPKRNPATRLSSHENLLFSGDAFARDDVAKRRSYAEGFNYTAKPSQDCPLSPFKGENESLSLGRRGGVGVGNTSKLMKEGSEITNQRRLHSEIRRSSSTELSPMHCRSPTSNKEEVFVDDSHHRHQQQRKEQYSSKISSAPIPCARMAELTRSSSSSNMEIDNKSPTVAQRRAKFEAGNHTSLNLNGFRPKSTLTKRIINKSVEELGPSSRKFVSKQQLLPVYRSAEFRVDDTSSTETPATVGEGSANPDKSDRATVVESASPGLTGETVDERIRRLAEKFAAVKQLLEIKQILPLVTPPPSFAPPPPPKPPRKQQNSIQDCRAESNVPLPSANYPKDGVGSVNSNVNRLDHVLDTTVSLPPDLCNGCLKTSGPKNKATLEDIPKILPADVSKMPQLGFSYSMEEDLPPGAKDILLTSTPKSEFSKKSTFNDSISSLGYGSSQSDLDLNCPCKDGNKVPVDNLKSQTLPVGMKLGPDYYSDLNTGTDCDSLENYGLKNTSFSPRDANIGGEGNDGEHFRSSSAPPFKLLEDEKKNKRSIFGMSRKESKVKNKNECNTSTKLKTSLDDGIILRRIETLGNDFSLPDFKVNKEAAPVEEKKRRSVWKSILRRK